MILERGNETRPPTTGCGRQRAGQPSHFAIGFHNNALDNAQRVEHADLGGPRTLLVE